MLLVNDAGKSLTDCLVNGELSPFVGADDRALAFGDGLWERVAVVNGTPWWWQDHMNRLRRGCELLGLAPPSQSVLLREIQTVTAGRKQAIVKLILSRGAGSVAYLPGSDQVQTRVITAYPWPEERVRKAQLGVAARVCKTRIAVQPLLGGINHLNRLEMVLAAREMADHEEQEGLLLDANDHLISAIDSNLVLVFGDQMLTPRMDRSGVRGVLRGRIIREFKARTELRRITVDMIAEASEVFLCDVVRGIVPVLSVDGLELSPGPVTAEMQTWLEESRNRP